jgi:hypothetical protein
MIEADSTAQPTESQYTSQIFQITPDTPYQLIRLNSSNLQLKLKRVEPGTKLEKNLVGVSSIFSLI